MESDKNIQEQQQQSEPAQQQQSEQQQPFLIPLLHTPEFTQLCKNSIQHLRNAEIKYVPENVASIAAMASRSGCGVHNVFYEISRESDGGGGGSEWVDGSRRVLVMFDGEVIMAGLFLVSQAFELEVSGKWDKTVRNKHSSPAILLDPKKWKRMSRGYPGNFGVFVSAESEAAGRRRIRSGQRVVTVCQVDNDFGTESFVDNWIHSVTNTKPLNSHQQHVDVGGGVDVSFNRIHEHVFAATIFPSRNSSYQNQNQNFNNNNFRLNNGHKIKNELVPRLLSASPSFLFGSKISSNDNSNNKEEDDEKKCNQKEEKTRRRERGEGDVDDQQQQQQQQIEEVETPSEISQTTTTKSKSKKSKKDNRLQQQQQQVFGQQQQRSPPKPRLIAFCCFGLPSKKLIDNMFHQLSSSSSSSSSSSGKQQKQKHQAKEEEQEERSVVLFLDLPALHCASKNHVQKTFEYLYSMISESTPCEIDLIVTCVSRFVASRVRIPEPGLMKLYIHEMRGRVEVVEQSSRIVCLNNNDNDNIDQEEQQDESATSEDNLTSTSNSISLMIEAVKMFANTVKIPYVDSL